MSIKIRQAAVSDAEGLLKYTKKILSEEGHNAPFVPGEFQRDLVEQEQILEKIVQEKNSVQFLAMHNEVIVGELSCRGFDRISLEHVTVLSMSVDIGYRSIGVGSLLMSRAVQWAKENPVISRVELYTFATNSIAQTLYEKFGFVEEGRRKKFVRFGDQYIDDLVMARLF